MYTLWQRGAARIGGHLYRFATKPGVFAHGAVDPAAVMLAEGTAVSPGDVVAVLNCGNALHGAVAARSAGPGGRVILTDRNVLSVEAARRTLAELDGAGDAAPHELQLGQGAHAIPHAVACDVVEIRVPHERLVVTALLRDAHRMLRVGGTCHIAGATTEGIKSAAQAMERLFGSARLLANARGHRLVSAVKLSHDVPEASADALSHPLLDGDVFHAVPVTARGHAFTLFSRPGVFSWEHLDEASAILADVLEVPTGSSVLDLGCGAGFLGTVAGLLGASSVTMLDADHEAVRCALRTAQGADLARAAAWTSDITSAVRGRTFDVVVCNPPFHVGKQTDLVVPRQFIREAHDALAPGGTLWLVANRTLPYEAMLQDQFGQAGTVHDGRRFKVLRAVRR